MEQVCRRGGGSPNRQTSNIVTFQAPACIDSIGILGNISVALWLVAAAGVLYHIMLCLRAACVTQC
jgi:hypothetical protein